MVRRASVTRPGLCLGLCLALASAVPQSAHAAPAAARKTKAAPKLSPALTRVEQAVAAFRLGDYASVRRHLLPLVDKPELQALRGRDYVLYLLGESEVLLAEESGDERLRTQAVAHLRAAEKVPGTPLATLARARAADCTHRLEPTPQRDTEVGTAYRAALTTGRSEIDGALVRFRLAEIASRAGKDAEARAIWRKLYIEHPLHPLGEAALERLRDSDKEAAFETGERITRAKNLIQSRRWIEAVGELRALPPDLEPVLRDEVDYWIGTGLYRMRRSYDVAAQKLLGVAPRMKGDRQIEAMFHGARALSRADQDDAAIKGYQAVVATNPRSRFAPEASFLTGWLEYNRSRYKEAIPALQETLRSFSSQNLGNFADDARWYIGLSRYFLKDYAGAIGDFDQLGKRSGMTGQKGTYWAGVSLLKLDRKAEAVERWRRTVDAGPLGYYAQLARVRLRDLGEKVTLFDGAGQRADGVPPWPLPLDAGVRADPQLLRVEELISVGLHVEAASELRRAEGELLKKYTSARALPVLVDTYQRAQGFQRPHLLAETLGAAALRKDPHKVPAARPFWEAKYPLAYRTFIEKYGPSGQNPPRYLYSIMQKESAYNPHDVSYADAIGLLQMIPPTSRRVAPHIGRPYTDDVLYDPEGNIQFGAWYIGRLLLKFKGQVALGAGSFNAGPKAMVRWLERYGDHPLDEFVELCPYTQTREYMKKLLDIYAHYVYLWDKEEYLPSLVVDKAYLSGDGIDY